MWLKGITWSSVIESPARDSNRFLQKWGKATKSINIRLDFSIIWGVQQKKRKKKKTQPPPKKKTKEEEKTSIAGVSSSNHNERPQRYDN